MHCNDHNCVGLQKKFILGFIKDAGVCSWYHTGVHFFAWGI